MAISLDSIASVKGEPATLTATSTSGNVLVWELTGRPTASELTLGHLTASAGLQSGVTAHSVANDEDETSTWVPDVPGSYTWTLHEIYRTVAIAKFGGDASGLRSEYVASQSGTVHIGDVVELPIVTELGNGATLELTVVDDTVWLARFTKELSEASRLAFENSTVRSALAALLGQDIATVGTDLQTGVNDLRVKYGLHRSLTAGSVHASADTTNVVGLTAAASQMGAIDLINEIRARYVAHLLSDVHSPAGTPTDDTKNVPSVGAAKNVTQAFVLMADLRAKYELHRVQLASPAVHGGVGDTTNTLTTPGVLETAIVTYLGQLVATTATLSANDPQGLSDAVQRYGFALLGSG